MNLEKLTRLMAGIAAAGIMMLPVAARAVDAKPSTSTAYPLSTCPVSGKSLAGVANPVVETIEGREVRFCCGGCPAGFKKDAAANFKKIDEKIIAEQLPLYPLDTCLVAGKKLGSMGEPVKLVIANRLVQLCCAGCQKPLEKNTADYIKKLDEAVVAKQGPDYKATKCPVSDHALGEMGDTVSLVYNGRLVKLCCEGCVNDFVKNPAKYTAPAAGEKQ